MNSTQAKKINLAAFLGKLGYQPDYSYPAYCLYKSPLRNERRASFSVCLIKHLWFDIAANEGGTIIDFAMQFFGCRVAEALKHIEEIMGNQSPFFLTSKALPKQPEPKRKKQVIVHSVKPLENTAHGAYLVAYLKSRGIPFELAKKYLYNVSIYLNGKHHFMLGWKNNNDGWELRSRYFKTATSKAFSFVPGTNTSGYAINVFEGMIDFLSALVTFGKLSPPNDTIILNSVSLVNSSLGYIQSYDKANLFLDFDKEGTKATKHIQANHLQAIDQRKVFARSFCPYNFHKDFNDYLVYR